MLFLFAAFYILTVYIAYSKQYWPVLVPFIDLCYACVQLNIPFIHPPFSRLLINKFVFIMSTTTIVTRERGPALPSGAPEIVTGFGVFVLLSVQFSGSCTILDILIFKTDACFIVDFILYKCWHSFVGHCLFALWVLITTLVYFAFWVQLQSPRHYGAKSTRLQYTKKTTSQCRLFMPSWNLNVHMYWSGFVHTKETPHWAVDRPFHTQMFKGKLIHTQSSWRSLFVYFFTVRHSVLFYPIWKIASFNIKKMTKNIHFITNLFFLFPYANMDDIFC